MKASLRTRLVVGIVLTLTVATLATTAVGVWIFKQAVASQARSKTQHDLASAALIYDAALREIGHQVRVSAYAPSVREALSTGQTEALGPSLEALRRREQLDVLNLLDAEGNVLVRARNPSQRGDALRDDPVIRRVMEGTPLVTATAVVEPAQLAREHPELARRAHIELIGNGGGAVEQGLVMQAAVAVVNSEGRMQGILVGWKLLNRDKTIVDTIKRTLYHGEVYQGREVGEGTLCLGDVRVATNAVWEKRRALGSRVDPVVRDVVLLNARERIDKADVLGERHLTAYEPIKDIEGRVIGILCLGIPEGRYTDVWRWALLLLLAISVSSFGLAFVIGTAVSRSVTRPIGRLVASVNALAEGDLERRWKPDTGIPEIEMLGTRFNEMADSIRERDEQLRHRTQQQIGRSERLAMIGRLAAGVAHEINNPLGGIMLFSNLLLRKAPADGPQRENLERIVAEAKRCQRIVQGLLDFARHREPHREPVQVGAIVDKTLDLVRRQALFHNVELKVEHTDCPDVLADGSQLQQVFANIVMNAAEAMEGKGTLSISSTTVDDGAAVQVQFQDTGCGMTEEQLDKLFEPFFTTKQVGQGTGLGLSISRGIVESHGGAIWALSEVGKGTRMMVKLPVAKDSN